MNTLNKAKSHFRMKCLATAIIICLIASGLLVSLATADSALSITGIAPVERSSDKVGASERPELVVQLAHSKDIRHLTFSKSGKYFATASTDGTAKLWDAATIELLHTLAIPPQGSSGVAPVLAFSPDDRWLATNTNPKSLNASTVIINDPCCDEGFEKETPEIDGEGSILLWNVVTGTREGMLKTKADGRVVGLAFTSDGQSIVTAAGQEMDNRSTITIWDVVTHKISRVLRLSDTLSSFALSPDRRTFATSGTVADKGQRGKPVVRLWDLQSFKLLRTLPGERDLVSDIEFSPDGKTLACAQVTSGFIGGESDTVLWDVATGRRKYALYQESDVSSIAFMPDGETLATAGYGFGMAQVCLWNPQTGKRRQTLSGASISPAIAFSPDGQRLLAANCLSLFMGDIIQEIIKQPNSVPKLPAGFSEEKFVLNDVQGALTLWDIKSEQTLSCLRGRHDAVAGAVFSPNGHYLATGLEKETQAESGVRLWHGQTGQLLHTLSGEPPLLFTADSSTLAIVGPFSQQVKKTGKGGASSGTANLEQYGVALYDASSGKFLRGLPLDESFGSLNSGSVALSPDGRTVAVEYFGGSDDSTGAEWNVLTLWDVASGKQLRRWRTHKSSYGYPLAFSPDGKIIATAGEAQDEGSTPTVQVWDVKTGKLLWAAKSGGSDGGEPPITLTFSQKGSLLAVRDDANLVLWNVKTGKKIRQLTTFSQSESLSDRTQFIAPIAFSPDETMIATESAQSTIKIWKVSNGTLMQEIQGRQGQISSLSFGSSGKVLVSGVKDGGTYIWNVTTGELLVTLRILAQKKDGKGLVHTEWIAYTPQGFYDASPGAAPFIRWRKGSTLFSAGEFSPQMHRTDLVAQAMQGKLPILD